MAFVSSFKNVLSTIDWSFTSPWTLIEYQLNGFSFNLPFDFKVKSYSF